MKSLDCWRDLRDFGFDRLTGEACPYAMRGLVDLSEKGAETWREFLGLPRTAALADNWNSGTDNPTGKSVASAMIPNGMFRELAVFALLKDGASSVAVHTNGNIIAAYPDDDAEQWERHLEFARHCKSLDRTFSAGAGPRVGSRMVHAATGRVA